MSASEGANNPLPPLATPAGGPNTAATASNNNNRRDDETVVRAGYLKKLKTFKKKFFVLRAEAPESSARLEYYDSEKKFNNNQPPKRCIPLKTCFNINKRVDLKHKHVIALYTKDDCFGIVLDSEEELETWLKALLSLQHGDEAADGETPRPTFEHVWQVTVLNRGLGGTNVIGAYLKGQEPNPVFRLCLTDKTLSLIRLNRERPQAEMWLSSVRSCGSLKNFFYLEIGRSSVTGAGELWMETEDANIALNVHETVFHAMVKSGLKTDDMEPERRSRSSSANESTMSTPRKHEQGETQAVGVPVARTVNHQRTQSLPLENPEPLTDHPSQLPRVAKRPSQSMRCSTSNGRERCDSMPSRTRTISEGTHPASIWNPQTRMHLTPHRPQSLCVREISHSPPGESPMSPPSIGYSTDSAGSSVSIDDSEQYVEAADSMVGRYGHSLTPDEPIVEENYEDCTDGPYMQDGSSPSGYLPMGPNNSYVDMSPRGRHVNMSPATSFSSVTSGTPSTDMRFAEYPLEKVSTYFTPSEEEVSTGSRTTRAYSVGARPEIRKMKTRIEAAPAVAQSENSRVRAFSVGAKSKKVHTRVLPPHSTHVHRPKSSSAPLLSSSSRTLMSHVSDNPMNDLMEMDFSRSNSSNNVEESPTSCKSNTGYLDMRPGIHDTNHNQPDVSPYVDMRSGSSPAKHSNLQQYVDMEPRTKINKNKQPQGNASLQSWSSRNDYMDMNYQPRSSSKSNHSTSPKYNDESPIDTCMDYMEMGFQNGRTGNLQPPKSNVSSTKDGYVEMSLGGKQKPASSDKDDYTDMSIGSLKERKASIKKEKNKSQPIQIQQNPFSSTTSSQYSLSPGGSSISPVYSSLHVGRKFSSGTPPNKMFLPFSSSGSDSYSSLPRQRTRKNGRRDSNNSSSSSVTTPSSSSTIFPMSLNSPTSPMKTESSSISGNKILTSTANVKYNSSRVNNNDDSDYTVMDFEKDKKTKNEESDYVNYNPSVKSTTSRTEQEQNSDYAIMKPGVLDISKIKDIKNIRVPVSSPSALSSQLSSMVLSKTGGYLNHELDRTGARCFIPISETREDSRYGAISPKPGDLAPKSSSDGTSRNADDSDDNCKSPVAKISRPNSVNSEISVQKAHSRPSSVSSCELIRNCLSRPSSASSEFSSSSSTIVNSRPESVNSETTRPSSVNIEGQLHYASLDLATTNVEEDANKSPRTFKSNSLGDSAGNNVSANSQPLESGFTYAEIDFVKSSEGYKHSLVPSNTKVKH